MFFQDLEYVFSGSSDLKDFCCIVNCYSDGPASISDFLAVFNTLYFVVLVLSSNTSMVVSFCSSLFSGW